MRRFFLTVAVVLVACPLFARDGRRNFSISTDSDTVEVISCSQIKVTYDGERVAVAEEDVPVGNPSTLRVKAPGNGGVRVTGGNAYSVKACKAEIPGEKSTARVLSSGGQVSTEGTDDDSVIFFIVRVPRNGSIEVDSNNGPVSVSGVDGNITARATNGPVAVKNSTGTIDASAINGPVAFTGNSGAVKLRAQNGPISVKLTGSAWGSGSLDARTSNGPVSLKLPRSYGSGVVVESDGRGPVSCRAEGCNNARREWDEGPRGDWDAGRPRKIELGSGVPAVHVQTSNGPISVKDLD